MIKKISKILLILALFSLPMLTGCQNELTDEGISYIASDTLGTLILDSRVDSMNVSANSFIKYINNSVTPSMFVGKSGNYETKTLLKYYNIPANYDTSTVISASLKMKYNKTFFQDSTGTVSFNIYRLLNSYDFSTVTYDKFNASDIGATLIGTYTGIPDTNRFSITLDNNSVKDWFKYAYDTNYSIKNYGLVLVPNNTSTAIKGFYPFSPGYTDSLLLPAVTVVLQNPGGRIDTLTLNYSSYTSLHYVPQVYSIPDRIVIQNGVAIKDIIHFDVSKLPGKVIINYASLELTLDYANSFISSGVDKRFVAYMLTSDTLTNDGITYVSGVQSDTTVYLNNITLALQKWNYSTNTNLGMQIQNVVEYRNLDRYVYYGPTYPDVTKRPRIKIRYSIKH